MINRHIYDVDFDVKDVNHRISVRLSPRLAQALNYMCELVDCTMTDLVVASLEHVIDKFNRESFIPVINKEKKNERKKN